MERHIKPYPIPIARWQRIALSILSRDFDDHDFVDAARLLLEGDYYDAANFLEDKAIVKHRVYRGKTSRRSKPVTFCHMSIAGQDVILCYPDTTNDDIVVLDVTSGNLPNNPYVATEMLISEYERLAPPSPPPSTSATNEPPRDGVGG